MSSQLVPKLVTLNELEQRNGSKLWYRFPGACLEVCSLVVEHRQTHTRHWNVSG